MLNSPNEILLRKQSILILAFGIAVFAEVVMKIFSDIIPAAQMMGGIGFLAPSWFIS